MNIKEHIHRTIKLAIPVTIAQVGHMMVVVADSVMVGQIGVVPLAAATFASTFVNVLMLFGIGVTYASTPLVAKADAAGKNPIKYLENGFLLNLLLAGILFAIGWIINQFMDFFGQEQAVAESAKTYMLIMCGSFVPLLLFQSFRQYSEGLSNTFTPMLVSVVGNLMNIIGNYLLIYGKWGFPELGLDGAGYSSLFSRVFMFLLMIWLMREKMIGFSLKIEWPTFKRLVQLGVPSGLQYVFEIGAFATAAIMVGWINAEALAAHNIALNLAAITYMASTGIASASTIRVGNFLGKKDLKGLRTAAYSGFFIVGFFMLFCGLCFIALRNFLPGLYIDDQTVQGIASFLLIIAAAFQLSDGLQAVGLGVLRGLADVRIPTIVTFIAFWITSIPLCYLLGFTFGLGIGGIWYGLSIGLTIAAVAHIWRFNRLTKSELLLGTE